MFKKYFPFIFIMLLTLIAGYSLLFPGIFPTHDGEYHVLRFQQFYKAFTEGDLYPRWAADFNNGYGVPLFNYVYPLPNYIASFLHVVGVSFIDAFKLNMFFAVLVGALFFYFWTKTFYGKKAGLVAAAFYTFTPYHFLDIYIRGSVGEVWSLAIFPGFLWSIASFIENKEKKHLIFSSILLALLVLSHNILALLFFSFSIIYVLVLYFRKGFFVDKVNLITVYLTGLGLSSLFWLPALLEKKYVVGLEVFDLTNHFPEIYQLIFPSWGSGFSAGSLQNEMSFQIGVANLIVFLLSILVLIRTKKKIIPLFFICIFILSFYMITPYSKIIWENVPLLNFFQFPWRILSLTTLVSSFLAGFVAYRLNNKVAFILLIILPILLSLSYLKPAYYDQRDDDYYLTRSNFTDGTNSPGNSFNTIWFKNKEKTKEKISVIDGSAKIKTISEKTSSRSYKIDVSEKSKLQLNISYFPGWKLKINNSTINHEEKNGLIIFNLDQGNYTLTAELENTLVRSLSFVLFLLSCLYIVYRSYRFKK